MTETGMRNCVPVEIQPVTVERPRESGVLFIPRRVGHFLKREAKLRKGRVRAPETLRAAEIRQPGIDPHAGTGSDQQRVSGLDRLGSLPDLTLAALSQS